MAALPTSSPLKPEILNNFQSTASKLQSCSSFQQAKQIHAYILRNNLSVETYAKLLQFCTSSSFSSSSSASLNYASLVFEHLQHEPTIFIYNTMIRFYASSNSPNRALLLYRAMRERGTQPNNYTFTFLIKACTANYSLLGPAIHAQSIVYGIQETDVHVYTSLLNMYATTNEGNLSIARSLFDRMKNKTAATWNSMIAGYSRIGEIDAARELFDQMPEKDEQSWNVMVCGYTRIGKFDVAERLFNWMPIKTLPTWNAMISGYTKASKPAEALALFRQMQLAGVRPDEITVVTVLPACALLGALEMGEWIHLFIEKNKFDQNISVCNAIIDMYAKCGCIEKAFVVFKRMRERNVVTWNTMISALAIHGRGEEAIELLTEMEDRGVVPDDITFVGLLNACAHTGLVERAKFYFGNMQKIYGIQPKIEHYGCMVDVLGRARLLDEALNLIDQMPMEPNSVILGSLLSACRICSNSQVGEKVLQKLVHLEPLNPGYYVLLSNMYASAGRWQEVTRVRNLMKSRGIEKIPGCSSIEIDNIVHEFIVGDKTHPQTQEVYKKIDEISQKLESAGYVPDTSIVLFDLDEEEKAQNLSVHSEKLAVAFGLLNTSLTKPIRVVKNLRVCRDCHSAIKLITQVYDREIILRDCNRFHHFKNGCCSCNDFW
ncbi:Pentatricopeptide repeat [Macleaya cordata]|uniref:Pentatricopeptide repeat n=1 Tax=Macleaya cordata TaxID=56857 RepID=A0A200QHG0_MACCD|nr:Pentatricopeptide repeat [Macleaya cordata]